ncbi:hypothetical protein AGLY_003349 [Aphis glycines]|uniref:Uncharacterized protein n=1 Tax=Aphis glycines TaxID=307491 RepID=A0A6G0U048_APHGL|nr:hypothetical protein AGLY_003349 [Aphis glycines]
MTNYDDITKDANYVLPGEHNSAVSIAISNVEIDKQLSAVEKTPSIIVEDIKNNTRKRLINKEIWEKNVKKQLRNSGKEYNIGSNEKVIAAKIMKMPCNDKCRLKCAIKISADERTVIHNNYWKLADINRQREFIIRHMCTINPKYRSPVGTNRSLNYSYSFNIHNKEIKVCKTMFMNTLGVSS